MSSLNRVANRLVGSFFCLLVSATLLILLFWGDWFPYTRKRSFALPNRAFLLLALLFVAVVAAVCYFAKSRSRSLRECGDKNADLFLKIGSVLLFFIQSYVIYCYYFRTSWDVTPILNAAHGVASGNTQEIYAPYFSSYPNNILLVFLYSLIIRVEHLLGISGFSQELMGIILVQCLLCVLTGYLLYKLIRRLAGSPWNALFGWLAFVALIAASPWISIPYSDAFGLIFPIAVFYLYAGIQEKKHIPLQWFFIFLLSYLGYKIKPQLLFALLSILLMEAVRLIGKKKKQLLRELRSLPAAALALVVGAATVFGCVQAMRVPLDKNRQIGPTHFFMMGLNDATDGSFYYPDYKSSSSLPTREERTRMNLRVAKERIRAFGPAGLAEHSLKKTLVNYNDGSFAWAQEAGKDFFHEVYPDKNKVLSPAMKSLYYTGGRHFDLFLNAEQFVWMGTLGGCLFAVLFFRRSRAKQGDGSSSRCVSAMMLSILMLTLFQLLFEARARYLFSYTPIYVTLGTVGFGSAFAFFRDKLKGNRRTPPAVTSESSPKP